MTRAAGFVSWFNRKVYIAEKILDLHKSSQKQLMIGVSELEENKNHRRIEVACELLLRIITVHSKSGQEWTCTSLAPKKVAPVSIGLTSRNKQQSPSDIGRRP